MIKDCNYFSFKVTFKELKKEYLPFLKASLNKIVYENEDEEQVIIRDRFTFIESLTEDNTIMFFIEEEDNLEAQISYLLDEEYELSEFDIDFDIKVLNNKFEVIKSEKLIIDKIEEGSFINKADMKLDLLDSFISGEYKDNSLCLMGCDYNELYGQNLTDKRYQQLAKFICNEIIKFINISENEITHIYTGGELGFNTIAFFAVQFLKSKGFYNLKNILVLPCEDFGSNYKGIHLDRFNRMKQSADYIIYSDTIPEYNIDIVPVGTNHVLKQNKCNMLKVDICSTMFSYFNSLKKDSHRVCVEYAINKGINYIALDSTKVK